MFQVFGSALFRSLALGFHNLSEKLGPSLDDGAVDLEELVVAAEQHLTWILMGIMGKMRKGLRGSRLWCRVQCLLVWCCRAAPFGRVRLLSSGFRGQEFRSLGRIWCSCRTAHFERFMVLVWCFRGHG